MAKTSTGGLISNFRTIIEKREYIPSDRSIPSRRIFSLFWFKQIYAKTTLNLLLILTLYNILYFLDRVDDGT